MPSERANKDVKVDILDTLIPGDGPKTRALGLVVSQHRRVLS